MELAEAIHVVVGENRSPELEEAEKLLVKRINTVTDTEEKAAATYYLLRLKLRKYSLYETIEQIALYLKLKKLILELEKQYWKHYRSDSKNPLEFAQIKAFYNLATYYLGSLETVYLGLNFDESARKVYEDKMRIRKRFFYLKKQYVHWLGYSIIEMSSRYGNSFLRWGFTGLVTVFAFAVIYGLTDLGNPPAVHMLTEGRPLYDYLYYSIVTFVTLGYGDILPLTALHKVLACTEVILGYFMLGMFIDLMNRKL